MNDHRHLWDLAAGDPWQLDLYYRAEREARAENTLRDSAGFGSGDHIRIPAGADLCLKATFYGQVLDVDAVDTETGIASLTVARTNAAGKPTMRRGQQMRSSVVAYLAKLTIHQRIAEAYRTTPARDVAPAPAEMLKAQPAQQHQAIDSEDRHFGPQEEALPVPVGTTAAPTTDTAADPALDRLNARAGLIAEVRDLVAELDRAARRAGGTVGPVNTVAAASNRADAIHARIRARLTDLLEQDERGALGAEHVTRITGPDGAGQFGYECDAGDADASGYESVAEALEAATAHGPLAADAAIPDDPYADDDQDDDAPAGPDLQAAKRNGQPTAIIDANGDPVPGADPTDDMLRLYMSGRVPAPRCPHYIAASEHRAGLSTCERCVPKPLEIGQRVSTPAGPGAIVEWNAGDDIGEAQLDNHVGNQFLYPIDGDNIGRTVHLIDAPADDQDDDQDDECEGHESLDGANMGATIYCDGTCRTV